MKLSKFNVIVIVFTIQLSNVYAKNYHVAQVGPYSQNLDVPSSIDSSLCPGEQSSSFKHHVIGPLTLLIQVVDKFNFGKISKKKIKDLGPGGTKKEQSFLYIKLEE